MYTRLTEQLKGLISFLQEHEVNFLQNFDSVLESMIFSNLRRSSNRNDKSEISEIENKIEVMQKNLETIIERLECGINDKKRFVEVYPKWRQVRKNGIQKLKEIAESLNSVKFGCNVTKVVGHSTSLLGGALVLASAISIPFTLGLTTPLAVAGGIMTGVGCGTTIGTSITETKMLQSRVSQAQEIIEEDERYYKQMCVWFKHAAELEEALAAVLNIDFVKDIAEDVKDFVKKALRIPMKELKRCFIEKALNKIIGNLPKRLTQALSFISIATFISVLVGLYVLLISTKIGSIILDVTHVSLRSILGIVSFMDDSADVLRVAGLFTSNATVAKGLSQAITRGALSVAGMALDVTGIVLTSIDIYDGSLTAEAEKILKATEGLEKEIRYIDEVYYKL